MGVIKSLICEPSLKKLQLSCFCTLMQIGYDGFAALVELAAKDYNSL
jgi:hypothetical protein